VGGGEGVTTTTLCRMHPDGFVHGCPTCATSLILIPSATIPQPIDEMSFEFRVSTEDIIAVPRVLPTFDELGAGRSPAPVFDPVEVPVDNRLVIVLAIMANAELVAIVAVLLAGGAR
jgi:hypothetical protein